VDPGVACAAALKQGIVPLLYYAFKVTSTEVVAVLVPDGYDADRVQRKF
jgi:hypothetical protein